jgi:hypothetical protein
MFGPHFSLFQAKETYVLTSAASVRASVCLIYCVNTINCRARTYQIQRQHYGTTFEIGLCT